MKNLPMKLLSIFLVLVLLVNMLPMGVFAQEVREDILASETQPEQAEDAEEISEASDPEIVAELTDQRTEFSKTFRMDNGLTMAVIYPDPIHYEKEGEWADIDNTLVAADNGSYTNTDGVWDVSFPEQLDGGKSVVIEKDGYTLSFSMAGQLLSQLSTARTSTQLTAQFAQASQAQPQQKESTPENSAEQVLEKLQSRVRYDDVYEDTDIVYNLESSKVKESVILESYNSALQGYRYILNVGEMTPVVEEDGQISFYDAARENVIMVMPAPFLVDDANVHNYDVEVNLSGSGSRYILTYLLPQQWLAAEDRAWPVVLDPVVTPTLSTSNIKDRTVASGATYSVSSGVNQTGYLPGSGVLRTYLKYEDLPELEGSETVVDAQLYMYKTHTTAAQAAVEVHKVESTWESSTITWANKPAYNSQIEDYVIAKDAGSYVWNVTGIVRDWYKTDKNTGMMFRSEDAAETSTTQNLMQFCSSDYSDYNNLKPILAISYRHNSGIEPYYTYQTMSAGHAGTAYICDSTGQLKVQKNIASFASTVNSFGANLVYNSDYFAQSSTKSDTIQTTHGIDMYFGNGFTLDIIQSVEVADLPNAAYDYLVWHDGDGTDHYFYREKGSTEDYKDEEGLNLTISVSGSDYTMKNDQGYTWFFDDGLLSEMYDETGNKIWIDWQGSGNSRWFYNIYQQNKGSEKKCVATVTYGGASYVNSVTDAAGRVLRFQYDSGRLTSITMGSTQIARYDYNSSAGNRITGMQDMESNYWLWFEYSNGKVKTYQEWMDSNTSGAIVEVTYSDEMTTYRDYGADRKKNAVDDILTNYVFDYFGRTVNAYSTDYAQRIIGASNAAFTGSGKDTENPKTNNRVQQTASIGVAAQNLLKNHGFESGTTGWTLSSTSNFSASTYSRHTGEKALECWMGEDFGGSSIFAFTSANLIAWKSYTFSAYVNTSWVERFGSSGCVRLVVTNNNGDATWSELLNYNTSGTADGWTRLSATITPETSGSYTLMVQAVDIVGWFYVDDVQLEMGAAPSNHNLIENGNLNISEYGWLMQQGGSYLTTGNGNKVLRCAGDPSKDACAWQNVPIELPGTETYVLSGWANAYSVPDDDNASENENYASDTKKRFGLQAIIHYVDNGQAESEEELTEYHYVPFCPDVKDAWQFTSLTIVPKKPAWTVDYIQVVCAYEKNANSVWFDEISLVREAAQSMRYDDEGNLISVTTTGMDEQTATYENGNLIEAYTGGSGTYEYTYDETYKHRVTEATDGVVKQSYSYGSNGNVIGTTLTKKDGTGTALTTTAVYQDYGNRVFSVTDANGNTVWNYYDTPYSKMTGAPTKVSTALPGTDNEDTATVWLDTETAYDNFGRVSSATVKKKYYNETIANPATLVYTYSNGNLTNIERTASGASQNYVLGYDVWGNNTSIRVGDWRLATYTYYEKNGNLESMTYGNDDKVSYTYDSLDRIKTQIHTDAGNAHTRTLSYTYTGDGQLYSIHDSTTGITQKHTYDALGRIVSSQNGSMQTGYDYDDFARMIRRSYSDTVLGYGYETYSYDSNTSNAISDGTLTSMRMVTGDTLKYDYDSLQRLMNRYVTGKVWEQYTYSGTQVATKKNWIGDTLIHDFTYTYDAVGNITSETLNGSTTGYTYDCLNQLTGVTGSRTESYTYDNAGNILTFNNGVKSHTMTYGDTYGWKDLLTAVDGETISYDNSGNPLTYYDGYSYTFDWTEGRRLASVTYGTQTTGYQYDYTGLRTKKTNPDGTYFVYHIADGRYVGETRFNADGTTYLYIQYIYDENSSVCGISLWEPGNSTAWENYYFIKNLQGDVHRIYRSSDNALVATYSYDAWGNVLSAKNFETFYGKAVSQLNPFRYRGYYFDNETYFYYLQSRYYDPAIGRWINADDTAYLGADGTPLSYNLFTYCKNNPVMLSDHNGHAPEWWQWAISGAMVVAGVALVATGVGGVAGGALICAGANSMIGSYVSEATGCSSVAGWVGGMITGAACGTGAGLAGNLLVQATNATGAACLGNLAAGGAVAFGSGTVGSAIGQSVSAAIDGKKLNSKEVLYASTATGAINCLSGLGAGIGTALQGMPAISTTTTTLANSLNAAWSLVSESVCDFLGTISSLLPW